MNFFIEQLNKFVISEQEYLESLQPIHGNESKEVQDVAHWLQEVKGVNISAMLPGLEPAT